MRLRDPTPERMCVLRVVAPTSYVRHRQPGSPHTGAVTAQPRHCRTPHAQP